jgi:hypothetical protein
MTSKPLQLAHKTAEPFAKKERTMANNENGYDHDRAGGPSDL